MANIEYEFFMSQIMHIRDIEDNEKTKISLVFYEGMQAPCVLKICKNRNLSNVYAALVKIRHPNVAVVYDYLYAEGNTYVIEEFVVGKTVQELLDEKGTFSEKDTVRIILAVCQGLEMFHAHKPPVVHNDIKTSNIMVREDGIVKLMDFDISRIYKEGANQNTRLFGTEEYASPEHYGFGQSEPSTDIYTLGVTMHEMLTGKGLTNEHKITYKGKLARIIQRCIEVDRTKRYQSAHQMKLDLEKFQKKKSRKFFMVAATCICMALLIVSGAIKEKFSDIDKDMELQVDASWMFGTEGSESERMGISGSGNTKNSETGTVEGNRLAEASGNSGETESASELIDKRMKNVYEVEGELKTMLALNDGVFIILEEISGKYYIKTSEGVDVPVDIQGHYGAKLIYDRYSDLLYLMEFQSSVINVYQVDSEYRLEHITAFQSTQSSDKSHISCSFFSDGRLLCNPMFKIIDSASWMIMGDAPAASYVINDKMYQFSSGVFYEVDSQGKVLEEYKSEDVYALCFWEEIYTDGKYAYFIGRSDDKKCVYRFDGDTFETVVCLNDYMNYASFDYDYLCVTEEVVRCYDEQARVVKEFSLMQ